MTTTLTREGVDNAEPLEFGDKGWTPPPNFPTVVLHVLVQDEDGDVWSATFNDVPMKVAKARIKQLGCKIVSAGANPTPAGAGPAPTSDTPPNCQNRNCSNYGKPMVEGQYSKWTCRGKDPTTGNQKGYCKSQAN